MKQAMIFAAGLGTRLKPLTDRMPKALVRVGGKPLIEHVILNLKNSGFERIVVNVHHFAGQIKSFLEANNNFNLDIRISDESDMLLDTGGGIKKAAPLFSSEAPILIHNVDILSNVDLKAFYENSMDNDATLLVSNRNTKRYLLFDEEMNLNGWTNIETEEVKFRVKSEELRVKNEELRMKNEELRMKNEVSPSNGLQGIANSHSSFFILHSSFFILNSSLFTLHSSLKRCAFSGIHIFSPRLFPLLENYPEKFGIMDFYLGTHSDVNIKGYFKEDLKLIDVGKLDTLKDAEAFLSNMI